MAINDGDIDVVAEAADGRAGVHAVRTHCPDVVLMDMGMPIMDGLDAMERIVADDSLAEVRVLMTRLCVISPIGNARYSSSSDEGSRTMRSH